ncbi:hypothetical protein Tco_0210352 [Tanacetum coccineum]
MVSKMKTQNAGRCTATTRGGGISEQTGREGERYGDQEGGGRFPEFATIIAQQLQNLLPTIVAQVGNHVNNQGNNEKQDDNVINDNNEGNVRTMNNRQGGCSYKEFMACNLKDYDGKGGAIVYTRWIEKMDSVQDMNGRGENQKVQTRGREAAIGMTWDDFKTLTREELCPNNEMQKLETEFWCHAMVEAGHAAYTDRFHKLARLIRIMVAATKPTIIQSDVLKDEMLTDEAIRNGALKKITEKSGHNREPSRDGNIRDDNNKD